VVDAQADSLLRLGVQIARNLSVDQIRRVRRGERLPENDDDVSDRDFADPLLREVIRGCVEKLPPQPRAALDARLQSGGSEPDPDLAEKLGMKPNTFLKNFGRARQLLLECLERAGVALGLKAERA
jgi:DNA-directed RNA polymerase specialized sigma24 family protein